MFTLRRKFPDSDGFCGSQKMPEEETFHSLQLCALAFSDLTRKPQSRRDYGDKGAIAHDFYTRDGYCYRPQKTSEPRILDSVLHEIYTKVYPICIRLSTASDLHDAHTLGWWKDVSTPNWIGPIFVPFWYWDKSIAPGRLNWLPLVFLAPWKNWTDIWGS